MNSVATRSRSKTVLFVAAVTILGVVVVLLMAEIAVRIRYATQHRDAAYLVMGIVQVKSKTTPRDGARTATGAAGQPSAPINLPTIGGTTQWNPCAQRDIYFRVNSAGGRGPEWTDGPPAGTIRILAIGESSTFGAANDEDQTWPSLLETELQTTHGLPVEVLNFGIPGQRIAGMVKALPAVLRKYRPDLVVHYGGFNDTWEDPQVPSFLSGLNYRSMLYTYIYEKMYFRAEASAMRLVPDVQTYATEFRRLVAHTRDAGAALVVIGQAVAGGATRLEGAACARQWRDERSMASCLGTLMEEPDPRYSRLLRSRMFKTVVFQQVLADLAAEQGVLFLDPRARVVDGAATPKLFCDEIHLTDSGNAVLVGEVAAPLASFLGTR
jgi:lysophospholipase L1-like esterase